MKTWRCILTALVLWPAVSFGTSFLFDQTDSALPPGAYGNIRTFQTVAQEFVPSLNRIDFFDYWIEPFPGSTALPTDVAIEIHFGSPFGQLVGRSQTVTLTPDLNSFTRFIFDGSLPLVAAQTYSANLLTTDDNALQYGIRDIINDPYPQGDFYRGAAQFTDAWFQEGVFVVPEPSIWSFTGLALLLFYGLKQIRS